MKKTLIIFILLIASFLSCEKDDICIDATTPNLIILFYNDTARTALKKIPYLTVWSENKDSIYKRMSLDSISIPLDLTKDNTVYKFSDSTIVDKINFSYTRKDVFVSRSCGYKTIFENLTIASDSINWIKEIKIINPTIDNETAAHIAIYH